MQFFHLSGVSLAPRIAVGILSLAHRGVLLRLRRRRRPTHTTEPTKTAAAAAAERARARRLQNKLFWNECVDGFGFQVGESNDRCSAWLDSGRREPDPRDGRFLSTWSSQSFCTIIILMVSVAGPLRGRNAPCVGTCRTRTDADAFFFFFSFDR